MGTEPERHKEEIENELLAFELVERKVELAIYVFVTIASAIATIVCLLEGYPWPAPSATGAASTVALVLGGWRARGRRGSRAAP
jgi:hypothetical protein